jgi:hypothetical protein
MTSTVRFIRCVSGNDRQKSVVRSLLTIIGQTGASSRHTQWIYRDEGPNDVLVVDIDDLAGQHFLRSTSDRLIIALGSNRTALDSHAYTLSKPLRWQDLMQMLNALEQKYLKTRTPAADNSHPQTDTKPVVAEVLAAHGPAYRLKSWPDLTRLREDTLHDAARICALLARRACTIGVISRTLDLPELRINRLLDSIRHAGHSDWECLADADLRTAVTTEPPVNSKPSSLLSKLWNRLRGGN